jgi:hypothetical protein
MEHICTVCINYQSLVRLLLKLCLMLMEFHILSVSCLINVNILCNSLSNATFFVPMFNKCHIFCTSCLKNIPSNIPYTSCLREVTFFVYSGKPNSLHFILTKIHIFFHLMFNQCHILCASCLTNVTFFPPHV